MTNPNMIFVGVGVAKGPTVITSARFLPIKTELESVVSKRNRPGCPFMGALAVHMILPFVEVYDMISVVLPINGKRLVPSTSSGALLCPLISRKGGFQWLHTLI